MKQIPRMRTPNEVYQQIKTEDPKTAIKQYTIEQLVNKGIIGHIEIGSKGKILVDYDEVIEYFNCRKLPTKQTETISSAENNYIPRKSTSRFKDFC